MACAGAAPAVRSASTTAPNGSGRRCSGSAVISAPEQANAAPIQPMSQTWLWYILTAVMRIRILAPVFLTIAAQAETVSSLWSRGYAAIPQPQQVELRAGDLRVGPAWSVDRGPGVAPGDVAAQTLAEEIESRFGVRAAAS